MEVFIVQTLYYINCICSIFSGYAFVLGILSLFRSPCKRWVRPRPSTPRRSWWWRNPGGWKPVAAGCELVLCLGPVGQCWGALPRAWGDLEVPCLGGGAWSHSSSKNHASPRALYARDGRAGAAAEERGHSRSRWSNWGKKVQIVYRHRDRSNHSKEFNLFQNTETVWM